MKLDEKLFSDAGDFASRVLRDSVSEGATPELKYVELVSGEFTNRDLINFKRVRGIIEHENTLMNVRISSVLQAHIFLFSAAVFLFNALLQGYAETAFAIVLVICLGMAMSYNVYRNVRRAVLHIKSVRQWWTEYLVKSGGDPEAHPNISYERTPIHLKTPFANLVVGLPARNLSSLSTIEAIPVFLLVTWIFSLVGLYLATSGEFGASVFAFMLERGTSIIVVLLLFLVAIYGVAILYTAHKSE